MGLLDVFKKRSRELNVVVEMPRIIPLDEDQTHVLRAVPKINAAMLTNAEFEAEIETLVKPNSNGPIFIELDRLFGAPLVVYGPGATAHYRTIDGAVEIRCPRVDGLWTPQVTTMTLAALTNWKDKVWFDARYGELGTATYLWHFVPNRGQAQGDEKFDLNMQFPDWFDLRQAMRPIAATVIDDLQALPPKWGLATMVLSCERNGDAARVWFNTDLLQVLLPHCNTMYMQLQPTQENAVEYTGIWLDWLDEQGVRPGEYILVADVDNDNFGIAGFQQRTDDLL